MDEMLADEVDETNDAAGPEKLRKDFRRSAASGVGLRVAGAAALSIVLATSVLVTPPPVTADEPPAGFDLVTVAEGVYAAIKPASLRFVDANVTVIVNEGDVVVVDAHVDPLAQGALIDRLRRLSDLPVRWVIATHWHTDHVAGIGSYLESFDSPVEVVGHATLAPDIVDLAAPLFRGETEKLVAAIAKAEERLASMQEEGSPGAADLEARLGRARSRLAWRRDVQLRAPTTTFTDRMTLRRRNRTIEMLHFEGHTRGDVVVNLPDDGVLITGDLVDDLPYGGDGYPRRWLESLRRIEALEWDVMVPGHGSIRKGKDHLRRVIRLLEAVIEQVDVAVAAGLGEEETVRSVELPVVREELVGDDDLAARAFDQFVPAMIRRAWAEARGEIPADEAERE